MEKLEKNEENNLVHPTNYITILVYFFLNMFHCIIPPPIKYHGILTIFTNTFNLTQYARFFHAVIKPL